MVKLRQAGKKAKVEANFCHPPSLKLRRDQPRDRDNEGEPDVKWVIRKGYTKGTNARDFEQKARREQRSVTTEYLTRNTCKTLSDRLRKASVDKLNSSRVHGFARRKKIPRDGVVVRLSGPLAVVMESPLMTQFAAAATLSFC